MRRWTARFTLLLMLVPIVGPLAMAHVDSQMGMHCMRHATAASTAPAAAEPAMHCHHGGAMATPAAASPEASIGSRDCCCCDHECCRGLTTPEWARLSSNQSSFVRLLIERVAAPRIGARISSPLLDADSARSPPRS